MHPNCRSHAKSTLRSLLKTYAPSGLPGWEQPPPLRRKAHKVALFACCQPLPVPLPDYPSPLTSATLPAPPARQQKLRSSKMPAKHASTVSVPVDGLGLYCSGHQMQNLAQNFAQDPAAHLSATGANMKAEDKHFAL